MSTYHTMKTNLNKIHTCKVKPKVELRTVYRCTFCTRAGPYSLLRMSNALACQGGYMQHVHVQIELDYEVYISKIQNDNTEVQVGSDRLTCPSHTRNMLLEFGSINATCLGCRNMCNLTPKRYPNLGPLRRRKVVWCTSSVLHAMQHYVPGRLYEQTVNNLPNVQTPVPSFIFLTHLQCCSR